MTLLGITGVLSPKPVLTSDALLFHVNREKHIATALIGSLADQYAQRCNNLRIGFYFSGSTLAGHDGALDV